MTQISKRVIPIKIGSKFGDLTIISDPKLKCTGKTTRAMFDCECKCGNITSITGTELRSGRRIRCSICAYKERPQSTMRLSNLERMYNLSIESRCKKGKIKNFLSIEEYSNIISKDCEYCGEKPKKISHLDKNRIALREDFYANGIDRIDSSKDYVLDNCVPCCTKCNIMKASLKLEDFKEHIKRIYKYICQKQEDIIKIR